VKKFAALSLIVLLFAVAGCASFAKTFAKYDTVELPRGQFDLVYADTKALVAVAKDRLMTKCAQLANLKNVPKRPDVSKLPPDAQRYILALEGYQNTGRLTDADCQQFKTVDLVLLTAVEQPVRDAIANPAISPNWDNIQKFLSAVLPILEAAGKAVVDAGVVAIP
jgi:hypothetical protein